MLHKNVSFIRVYEHDGDEEYPNNAKCLDVIGYISKSMRDMNRNGFTYRALPNDDDDIIYVFVNDLVILISCTEIILLTDLLD